MQKKPFNQFQAPRPSNPLAATQRWYRRHIIVDHRHKEVLIQIMWDGHGELKSEEYTNIINQQWWRYVPKERIDEFRQALASGYRAVPIVVSGGNDGEEHVTMQLIELTNTHNVIHDSSLAALPE